MPKKILPKQLFRVLSFLFFPFLLLFSGCSLPEKFSLSAENPAVEKNTNLTNAQRLNQEIISNPIPLVPGNKNQTTQTTKSTIQQTNPPTEKSPEEKTNISYDQEKWKTLAKEYNQAVLKTNFGEIKVDLFGEQSPLAVGNFIELTQKNFYDQTKFHRVIKDFMIQGGDPNSKDDDWSNDGKGGPGYKFPDEQGSEKLVEGTLAMANSGPNTNGSQFFIVTAKATPWLDGKHTVFGKVANEKSLEIVKKIEKVETDENDHPKENVTIEKIELLKKEDK